MTSTGREPQALQSRLLADLVQALSDGHLLQATTVGVLVGRNAPELVQQASRSGDSVASDQHLQLHLRNIVRVLSVAERHFGNVLLAIQWYRTDGLAQGPQQTPEALTAAGRLEDAYRRLLRKSHASCGEPR